MNTKSKKVIIFSVVHRWNDPRIFYKQATSLAKKHRVVLWAPAPFKRRNKNKVTILGLPRWEKKISRFFTQITLVNILLKSHATIYHFHDPELIPSGLLIKWIKKKTVIYDKHENIPFGLVGYNESLRFKKRIMLFLYMKMQSIAIRFLDKVIIAEKSYSNTIKENYLPIYNYPILPAESPNKQQMKKYAAIYIGGITKERGIFEIIEITRQLKTKIPKVIVRIIGPIMDNSNSLIYQKITEYNLQNNILISDYLPYDKAMKELKKSKVGLALLHPDKNYSQSIPTKIFEYMCYGLPFIASDFPYWREYLGKQPFGFFVDYRDVQAAAEFILKCQYGMVFNVTQIYQDTSQHYNWESEEKKLLALYDKL